MFDQCLYFNTTALARQLERTWAAAFQPFGLTPPQAFLLRAVLAEPGLPASELARRMAISKPTATRSMDGLLAKGLIERAASGRDGREWAIHPTDAALALHTRLNRASATVTDRLKKRLGPDAFSATVSHLRTARTALD